MDGVLNYKIEFRRKEMTFEQKLHKNRDEVVGFCSNFEKIYLYGAGFVAEQFILYLQEESIELAGIIVSDIQQTHNKELEGIPVYELENLELDSKVGIIIAISDKKTQLLIIENLKRLGISDNDILMNHIFCTSGLEIVPNYQHQLEENGYFSKYSVLDELGVFFMTDKSRNGHNYCSKYEFFLERWKKEEINLLELGVLNGASIKMWSEYFQNAKIYGVDIDSNTKQYEGDNRIVLIRNLSKKENIIELRNISPTIIIDDASHCWSHQIKSFYYLFTCLPHGGVFIMEDIGTSFGKCIDSLYADCRISAYDFFSGLSEMVASDGESDIKLADFRDEIADLAKDIEMISISSQNCIVIKK